MDDSLLKKQIEDFKKNPVFSPLQSVPADQTEDKIKKKEVNSFYYGFILYPTEDPKHKKMLDYCTTRSFYKYVYILHDKDKIEDESGNVSLKKPHIHLMLRMHDRRTPSSVLKWFGGWVDFAEPIKHPKDYVLYLLHCSPEHLEDPLVYQYSTDDLHGHDELWKGLLIQNSHFVQLREVLSFQPYAGTFMDTFESLPDDRRADLGEFMWENRFFLKSILKEESSRYFEIPLLAENREQKHLRTHCYSSNGVVTNGEIDFFNKID